MANLSPRLGELHAYITLADRGNCLYFETPSDAGFVDTTLLCIEAVSKAVPLPWYPSFPWSSRRLYMSVGVSHFPSWGKRLKSTWNQSWWHLHKPGPWPQSCTLFHCFYNCENWDVGNPSSKLPSAVTHGRSPGGSHSSSHCRSGLLGVCLISPFLPSLVSWPDDPDSAWWDGLSLRWDGQHSHVQTATPKGKALKPKKFGCLIAKYVHEAVGMKRWQMNTAVFSVF